MNAHHHILLTPRLSHPSSFLTPHLFSPTHRYKLYADDAVAMYGMAGACVLVLLLLGTATLPSSGKVDKGKLQ